MADAKKKQETKKTEQKRTQSESRQQNQKNNFYFYFTIRLQPKYEWNEIIFTRRLHQIIAIRALPKFNLMNFRKWLTEY
jgi:hypothetical protein